MSLWLNATVGVVCVAAVGALVAGGFRSSAPTKLQVKGVCDCGPADKTILFLGPGEESVDLYNRLGTSAEKMTIVFNGTAEQAEKFVADSKSAPAMMVDPNRAKAAQDHIERFPAIVVTRGKQKTVVGNGAKVTDTDLAVAQEAARKPPQAP
jgi:hypothetical protein